MVKNVQLRGHRWADWAGTFKISSKKIGSFGTSWVITLENNDFEKKKSLFCDANRDVCSARSQTL